jgi:hypothetical protein
MSPQRRILPRPVRTTAEVVARYNARHAPGCIDRRQVQSVCAKFARLLRHQCQESKP